MFDVLYNEILLQKLCIVQKEAHIPKENYRLIYGIRNSFFILNSVEMIDQLRSLIYVILDILNRGGRILCISDDLDVSLLSRGSSINIFNVSSAWKGGTLTNLSTLVLRLEQKHRKRSDFILEMTHGDFLSQKRLPDFVLFLGSSVDDYALRECKKLKLLTGGLVSLNIACSSLDYPVVGNFNKKFLSDFLKIIVKVL